MLRIKELREEAQLTQKQLAEQLSTMQRNVSNWENGVSEPDLATVVALADFFGVTLDELFGREFQDSGVFSIGDFGLLMTIKMLNRKQKDAINTLIKAFTAL